MINYKKLLRTYNHELLNLQKRLNELSHAAEKLDAEDKSVSKALRRAYHEVARAASEATLFARKE